MIDQDKHSFPHNEEPTDHYQANDNLSPLSTPDDDGNRSNSLLNFTDKLSELFKKLFLDAFKFILLIWLRMICFSFLMV